MAISVEPAGQAENAVEHGSLAAAARVGEQVAALYADEVDRDARFPAEAVDAMRRERLLGALVPVELGGRGATLAEVAEATEMIAQHCASAAMVFAMHQIQVACLIRHVGTSWDLRRYLREVAERQLLLASATSEVGVGGDLRTSLCAVAVEQERYKVAKDASVISYGAEADDILVTARRAPDAASNDQVLVVVRQSDRTLTPTGEWDTLGFRGTCSRGFRIEAEGPAFQVLGAPFDEIARATMLPVSHVLWASVWLGMAGGAVRRARTYVRAEARKKPGTVPASAVRLAEAVSELQSFRGTVRQATADYTALMDDAEALGGLAFAIRMNNLKLLASQAVVRVVAQALAVCGMAGYKNGTPYSLGRHLRDAYGAALMIGNDRLIGANAALLLIAKDD